VLVNLGFLLGDPGHELVDVPELFSAMKVSAQRRSARR